MTSRSTIKSPKADSTKAGSTMTEWPSFFGPSRTCRTGRHSWHFTQSAESADYGYSSAAEKPVASGLWRRGWHMLWRDMRSIWGLVMAISRRCLRSWSRIRWVLYWLVVLSLICFLLWFFMPQPSVFGPGPHTAWTAVFNKMNALYLLSLLVVLGGAPKR
jgi:hypothetical protein